LFCLSAAAMLGLGALLASSEILFNAVKIIGAGYLFYLGVKQLFKKGPMLPEGVEGRRAWCGRLAASCTSRRS
jgi:threonine/homoserine/homoserine lactone efflux protein